jgi:hypothetical protein
MAQHDRTDITQLFVELIQSGKSLDSLAQPFRAVRSRQVVDALLAEGNRVFDLLLKKEATQISRFLELLDCLDQRKDADTAEFLLACVNGCDKVVKLKPAKNTHLSGEDVVERLAALVYTMGSPRALETILARRDALPASAFNYVLRSALRTWPAENFYQEFAALFQEKKGAGKEKGEALRRLIWESCGNEDASEPFELEPESPELRNIKWDARWLEAAIQADATEIVCLLSQPQDKGAHRYLLKQLEKINAVISPLIIETLARCRHPEITDVFIEVVNKAMKRAKTHPWEAHSLLASAKYLPPQDLPKLETFAARLDEKFVDPLLEAIQPLRTAKTATPL